MAIRCKEEAEQVLGNHFDALADIVSESVRFYWEYYGERAHAHEPWTRCSIIRDEIKVRLTAYCETVPGFQLVELGNATFFGAFSKFTIRIKKLFDNLHANTGKTQYSFEFDHQIPVQADLFDDAALTHLYLGYVATENDPLNPPIYLVCNDEAGKVAWNIPLNRLSPPPSDVVTPLPFSPPSPDTPQRVRVKDGARKKKEANE